MWVQTEKFGDLAVATQLERFETGVQAPLLFVKQAGKQDNRRPHFIGNIAGRNVRRRSGGLIQQGLPCPQLLLPRTRIGGAVQIQAGDGLAGDPALRDQLQQGLFDWNMEDVCQFRSEIASLRLRDVVFRSGHQGTVTGEPDRVERPQAPLIETGNLLERVEGASMGVAGVVRKLLQLAKNSDIGLRAQQLLQLRQCGDAISAQELAQHVSGKEGGAHNAVIPPCGLTLRRNYIIMRSPLSSKVNGLYL